MKPKYMIFQTVQLKGSGIPGVISDVANGIPRYKTQPAYEVDWVDGTRSVHMEEEISPISQLKVM
ncbi:hypothetical protein CPT_Merlin225 [Citrobacter phage Merlin]|uniref:Uncharacterized protein n=1 Tax=Citrobacter phage Merlin TaxID=1675602 RepID=A0A0K1LMU2_9CAUD|nr:hypothetical protein CPT_Merlin225 [Citrobacter phage Merlin]AKU43871.1 hypothetical protein CPT_Merlin225 [Citrobacter phage Merlin]